MAAKSDLMRVAQSAGRLNVPESYETWMIFLNKALDNLQKSSVNTSIVKFLEGMVQPKDKILHDSKTRLKWAEKILDTACRIG